MFKKQLENKLNTLHQILPDTNAQSSFELEFVSNFQVQKKKEISLIFIQLILLFTFQGYTNRCKKYIRLRTIITRNSFIGKGIFNKKKNPISYFC
jgi:hypothetical protein